MKMKDYNIVFSGLKLGKHQFNYKLDQKFFDLFEFQEMEKPEFEVELLFDKRSTMFELDFQLKGSFSAVCDITNEPFNLPLSNKLHLVVKFAEELNDEDDEILVLPFESYEMNVAQYLYEMTVLSIPIKKVHPDVESGKIGQDMLKYLKTENQKDDETTDPRWDKLKDLLK